MVRSKHVDVAIIGAGTAGMAAYKEAIKYTPHVVLIESHGYGTLCAKAGCMPSKLLIAAANAARAAQRASDFGLYTGQVIANAAQVMQRVRAERDRFVSLVRKEVAAFPTRHKILGTVKFIDDHQLQLGNGSIIYAKCIVIATGSHTGIPTIFKIAGERLLTSDNLFELNAFPKNLAIIGTGPLGMELGVALYHLGTKVHFFSEKNDVGRLSDPVLNKIAIAIFKNQFPITLDAKIVAVHQLHEGVALTYRDKSGRTHRSEFSHILVATGRAPAVESLALEYTAIKRDKHGTPHFNRSTMQCLGAKHIFIAGDADNAMPLLHVAQDQGRMAGHNAANYPRVTRHKHREKLAITFCEPQIAQAGMRYRELKENKVEFVIGTASFDDQGRARMMRKNEGMLRLYADKETGRLLGGEMIGPAAEHLMHLIAWCIASGMTVEKVLTMPFYHPTLEEALRTALQALAKNLGRKTRK